MAFKKYAVPFIMFLIIAVAVTIVLVKRKTVTVEIDGKPQKVATYGNTVLTALESEKIPVGPKDKITPDLQTKIANKDIIRIKRAVSVYVTVDDKEISIHSAEPDINTMLKSENIYVGEDDKIKPEGAEKLSDGMKIEVIRVGNREVTESIALDFKTIVKKDENMPNVLTNTIQEGKSGEKKVTYQVEYHNGKEVSRKQINENLIRKPVDKIIARGTLPTLPVSRGGKPIGYTKTLQARSTAYYAVRGVGKTYTASGMKAVRNSDGYSTIAVDPSIIPFGTRVYIEHYGFAIAADSGTGVKGNSIDVFFNTYGEACRWGVKYVKVYYIK